MDRSDDRDAVRSERPQRGGGALRTLVALLVVAVIVAVVLVAVLRNTSSDSAKNDVKVTTCAASAGGKPKATGTILNHSSKTSTYVIRLEFTDPQGNTVSEGVAPVANVGANKAATWRLTGARSTKGSVRCEITGVTRTHLPGQ